MARGPLPIADVFRTASEIADALPSAHDRGIAHRDLKPANIMLTRDGSVKVLDVGLAKGLRGDHDDPTQDGARLSNSGVADDRSPVSRPGGGRWTMPPAYGPAIGYACFDN
jgi:serine/threonine protein kinase